MARNTFKTVVYVTIGLAVIGLLSQLFTNALGFFAKMLISLGIGLAIFGVIYLLFFRNRTASSDTRKYKQAVKQSKAKYNQNYSKPKPTPSSATQNRKQVSPIKKKSHKRPKHLRVIDGNKSKRKKRASN